MINATSHDAGPRAWIGDIVPACLIVAFMTLPISPAWADVRDVVTESEQVPADETAASVARIEATLGQLQTNDEAALRGPLLSMRRTELKFRAFPDIRYEQQLSRWAGRFSELLGQRTIPDGTRIRLATGLAEYQRDALRMMDATLAAQGSATLAGDDDQDQVQPEGHETPVRWFEWMIAMVAVVAAAWLRFKSPIAAPRWVDPASSAGMVDQAASQALLSTRLATQATDEMNAMAAEVRSLTGMARNVERAVKIAGDVSGQTRTLAQIAQLEADRAGAAGAGFAVVANRCQALADWTSRAAGELTQPETSVRPAA
jgi:hypothetical protein